MTDWKSDLRREFERAAEARTQGNQGQARVCARRAAGIAIREYFSRRGDPVPSASAYDLLGYLGERAEISPELKQAATNLRLRVTEEFKLPQDLDLEAEARTICRGLLSDWQEK